MVCWGIGVWGVWEFTVGGFTGRGPDVRQRAIDTAFAPEMHSLAVGDRGPVWIVLTYVHTCVDNTRQDSNTEIES